MIILKKLSPIRTVSAVIAAILSVCISICRICAIGVGVPSDFFNGGTAIVTAEEWITSEDTRSSVITNSAGKSLRLYAEAGEAEITSDFQEPLEIGDSREIGLYVTSISENDCSATLTVNYDSGRSSVSTEIPKAEKYYIFTPIPDDAETVTDISVKVTVKSRKEKAALPVSAIIGNVVFCKTDHSKNIKLFSAFEMEGLGKNNTVSDKAPVVGSSVSPDSYGKNYAAIVNLTGDGGGITFGFSPDGNDFTVCGSAVISPRRSSYIFPVEKISEDSAYKIEFTGTENTNVKLNGVSFIPIKSFSKSENLGTVSKCSFSDDTVSVSGSITRDAAVKYIDGEVCLFEIPMWEKPDIVLEGEPADAIKMSTSFSFSLPTTSDYSVFTSYIVAIKDEDGVYPLSDAVYPSFTEMPGSRPGTVSVSGILPEEAFTHGFDSFVIDVEISSLLLEKSGQNTTVFTYDGYPYYLNKEIITDIDKKVQFLSGSGIGIIFRVTDMDSFSAINYEDCRKTASAVSYLSDTFSPMGIIWGTEQVQSDNLPQSASDIASVIRMVSAATDGKATVFLPIDQSDSSETFAWLLGRSVSYLPKTNMEILITDSDGNDDISEGIMACAADGGYTLQYTISLTFENDAPLSFAELTMGSTGISYLMEGTSDTLPDIVSDTYRTYNVSTNTSDGGYTVTLWDFKTSYDSSGFTVPEGDPAIFTGTDDALEEYTGIPACRALKTVLGKESGVIMATPPHPLDLTDYSRVRLMFSTENTAAAAVNIIFISGKERAIFPYTIDSAGVYYPMFDLSQTEISGRIDRIAIVLTEGENLPVNIASITASGDSAENEGIYITEASSDIVYSDKGVSPDSLPLELMAIIITTVTTVVVFVILTKRKTQ